MIPEHVPRQDPLEEIDFSSLFQECLKKNPEVFKIREDLAWALQYILQFDPESRLEIINEKIAKNKSIDSSKKILREILEIAKRGLKEDLVIDDRLKKVIENRILRMEIYLAGV